MPRTATSVIRPLIAAAFFCAAHGGPLSAAPPAANGSIVLAGLPGVVVDDAAAQRTGQWVASRHVRPFVGEGYLHDDNRGKGEKSLRFRARLAAGRYQVLLSYTPGKSRAPRVPVTIATAEGPREIFVDLRPKPAAANNFQPLGMFLFAGDKPAVVEISNRDTTGYVTVDAVQFLPADQAQVVAAARPPEELPLRAAARAWSEIPGPPEPPPDLLPLTSARLDALLGEALGESPESWQPTDDATFLRRLTLDLFGRQPTTVELDRFRSATEQPGGANDSANEKRQAAIERMLASPEFGANWSNYWIDAIGYRVPQPELTFLNYDTLRAWLAAEFNRGRPWDEIVRDLVTAKGKVGENPPAAFVGFHQANVQRLASETTRLFLGVQIQCAECHEHPFVDMPRETFHQMAAFFVRSKAKLPWNDSDAIVVSSEKKGEYRMPDMEDPQKSEMMHPATFGGRPLQPGRSDDDRRAALARWLTRPANPWFAKAHVNHVWGRLMGRGFCEPIDEIGEGAEPVLPQVHAAVAEHFGARDFDVKDLFRLIASTRAYQRYTGETDAERPFASAVTTRLRGDEVFASLVTAIELPNVRPPAAEATTDLRFPPPPKSTRDLVYDVFGFDPALPRDVVSRTMPQAMFMMNNAQLQRQIDAAAPQKTMLARLLKAEPDDRRVVETLFRRVLARPPSPRELEIAVAHVAELGDRGEALEDLLWSLLNSAEFTTRR